MKKAWLMMILLLLLLCSGCESGENPAASAPADEAISVAAQEDSTAETSMVIADADFTIHFFDVGQADAALILCEGQSMLIDGGNVADTDEVIASLKGLGIERLNEVVVTHTDEDHLGGIAGVLQAFPVDMLFATESTADTGVYRDFMAAVTAKNLTITPPVSGSSISLGGSSVTFLGPLKESSNPNNNSVILRVDYGETSFLFTGDAMKAEEDSLLTAGADLHADVLKVGHHGGEESTSYVFLREIMPTYAVISVGEGNSYGHPTEAVLSRLSDAGATVFRTDLQGEITCSSNGKEISFTMAKYHAAPEDQMATEVESEKPMVSAEEVYIGNINSKKLHRPDCGYLPDAANSVYFATKEEAFSQGYTACSRCEP